MAPSRVSMQRRGRPRGERLEEELTNRREWGRLWVSLAVLGSRLRRCKGPEWGGSLVSELVGSGLSGADERGTVMGEILWRGSDPTSQGLLSLSGKLVSLVHQVGVMVKGWTLPRPCGFKSCLCLMPVW